MEPEGGAGDLCLKGGLGVWTGGLDWGVWGFGKAGPTPWPKLSSATEAVDFWGCTPPAVEESPKSTN